MPEPMETGLMIPVPELDWFTSRWRAQVDRVPPVGVPAHITLLYPFVPPSDLEGSTRRELNDFFSARDPFDFELTKVGRFGEDIVYLAPEPVERFLHLTELLVEQWPEYPPYSNEFDDIVPHLTIGSGCTPEGAAEVIHEVERLLPVRSRATEAWLMVGRKDPSVWQLGDRFPLGNVDTGADGR